MSVPSLRFSRRARVILKSDGYTKQLRAVAIEISVQDRATETLSESELESEAVTTACRMRAIPWPVAKPMMVADEKPRGEHD